jgi:hypothetical protein
VFIFMVKVKSKEPSVPHSSGASVAEKATLAGVHPPTNPDHHPEEKEAVETRITPPTPLQLERIPKGLSPVPTAHHHHANNDYPFFLLIEV